MGQQASSSGHGGKGAHRTSTLEQYFHSGQWDEIRSYLRSAEGKEEVEHGLLVPRKTKDPIPALFVALMQRAPLDICETIHKLNPVEIEGMHLHAAIDGASERRVEPRRPNSPIKNTYDANEQLSIMEFLVLRANHDWLVATCPFAGTNLTPLAHAVWNRDVSSDIVKLFCFACPDAIDLPCQLSKDHVDMVPIDLSIGQQSKRDLLLLGWVFYRDASERGIDKRDKIPLPAISAEVYASACSNAEKRKNWDLVRDLLPSANKMGAVNEELESIRKGLEAHDEKMMNDDEKEQWRRKYFGPVMVELDIIKDMFSPVLPASVKSKKKNMYVPLGNF